MNMFVAGKKWVAPLASMMLVSALAAGISGCTNVDGASASGSANASASTSQSNGVAIAKADLVGKWSEVSYDSYYVFSEDGTGEQSHRGKTAALPAWRIEDNHLYLEIAGHTPEDYSVELNASKDTLIIHNPADDFTYKKN